MKNFSTWLLVMFMGLFWVLRIAISVSYELGGSFGGMTPYNQTLEKILLFVVLLCMVLIVKRKIVGAIIYLLGYGMYFSTNIVSNITTVINATTNSGALPEMGSYLNLFVALIGLILPIAVMVDMLLDRNRKANPKDKKTDWFYKNEQFDREVDERADKNNYRTL